MPRTDIVRSIKIERTPRVMQIEGLFDVPRSQESELRWEIDLPLDEREWAVGLIVGASGSGKSVIARELFGPAIVGDYRWPKNRSLLDGFPQTRGIKEITSALSSVGFSSPPSWLRPFHVLSMGEQFRVTIARALMDERQLIVIDEFTSVVDRTVAKIGSAAVAKAVRRAKKQLIAVSCHNDVTEWLDPDWIYEPATASFAWRSLQGRPAIELEICRVDRAAWRIFKPHHYLSGDLHRGAACYLALYDGEPAAFTAVLSFPHPRRPGWREHRTVCLPDYQGVGIGNAMSEFVAHVYRATGKPYTSTTSSPAMIRHRAASPLWRVSRQAELLSRPRGDPAVGFSATAATSRLTWGFEFMGPPNRADADGFGVVGTQTASATNSRQTRS